MTTNQTRALRLLNDLAENQDGGAGVFDAVAALADAGLLAPDLPTPDRDGRWWPTAGPLGSVSTRGRHVYIHSGILKHMGIFLAPDDADDLAGILKAAAAAARAHQEKK